jgi:hypothetical protein
VVQGVIHPFLLSFQNSDFLYFKLIYFIKSTGNILRDLCPIQNPKIQAAIYKINKQQRTTRTTKSIFKNIIWKERPDINIEAMRKHFDKL